MYLCIGLPLSVVRVLSQRITVIRALLRKVWHLRPWSIVPGSDRQTAGPAAVPAICRIGWEAIEAGKSYRAIRSGRHLAVMEAVGTLRPRPIASPDFSKRHSFFCNRVVAGAR